MIAYSKVCKHPSHEVQCNRCKHTIPTSQWNVRVTYDTKEVTRLCVRCAIETQNRVNNPALELSIAHIVKEMQRNNYRITA